jgi:EmrB/QacA subfamily drug resistance transporter
LNRAQLTPLIVATSLLMETVDSTVISTSLPLIAADLNTDPLSLKLAMTTYLLSLAVFIPASGWIADRFGAKRVYCAALIIFAMGSVLSGSVTNLWQLVLTRALQGFGGSLMVPVARLIVLKSVPREQMVAAFVWLTVPAMVGPLMGPPVGGFISTYFSWRWIFWLNIPFCVLGVALALAFIEDVREDHPGRFDLTGFVLAGLGFCGFVFGLSLLGGHFVSASTNAAIFAGGVVCLILYIFHARRIDNPVLDLSLLRVQTFAIAISGGFIFRICNGAVPFLMPLLFQVGFGMSPIESGLTTFVGGIGATCMKFSAPPILRHLGFRRTLTINGVIVALSYAVIALFTSETPHWVIVGVLLAGGFFRSLQFTATNGLAFADIETQRMSRATTLNAAIQQAAASSGVALGAAGVDFSRFIAGREQITVSDFGFAFLGMALISVMSVLVFRMMPANAAEGISGPMFKIRQREKANDAEKPSRRGAAE